MRQRIWFPWQREQLLAISIAFVLLSHLSTLTLDALVPLLNTGLIASSINSFLDYPPGKGSQGE